MSETKYLPYAIIAAISISVLVTWGTMTGLVVFDEENETFGEGLDSEFLLESNGIINSRISQEEFLLHNTSEDCWILYNTMVYDFSYYVLSYEEMESYCGSLEFVNENGETWQGEISSLNEDGVYIGILESDPIN